MDDSLGLYHVKYEGTDNFKLQDESRHDPPVSVEEWFIAVNPAASRYVDVRCKELSNSQTSYTPNHHLVASLLPGTISDLFEPEDLSNLVGGNAVKPLQGLDLVMLDQPSP